MLLIIYDNHIIIIVFCRRRRLPVAGQWSYHRRGSSLITLLLLYTPTKLRYDGRGCVRCITPTATSQGPGLQHHVPVELLRERVPAMLPDGVPGGPGGPAQGLHVLPQRVLQVRRVRHEADAEDVLQQPAPAGGQGGVLFEPRAENRAGPPGRHVGGHQERAERAQVDDIRQRPDTRQR